MKSRVIRWILGEELAERDLNTVVRDIRDINNSLTKMEGAVNYNTHLKAAIKTNCNATN